MHFYTMFLIAMTVFLMIMVEFSVGKENTERRHDQLALPSNIRKQSHDGMK